MALNSPFCTHVFIEADCLDSDGAPLRQVSCPCGYTYELRALQDFAKLDSELKQSQSRLADHVKSMAMFSRERFASNVGPSATQTTGYFEQSATFAPPQTKPQPAQRTRVAISPQQWLIIGASILVMVAGSIFVAQGIAGGMPREQFLTITGVLALLTAFGGLKTRTFSVLIANFLASFSAVMVYYTMMNVGSLAFNTFLWNNAPAWWQATTFAVIAASSLVLARISANFGWKAITILGWIGAGLAISYGPLSELGQQEAIFGYSDDIEAFHVAPLVGFSLTALCIPLLLTLIRRIPAARPKSEADAAYEADLFERETKTLWRFGQFSTLVVAILGAGKLLSTLGFFGLYYIQIQMGASALVWLAALALVWLTAGAYSSRWTTALTADGSEFLALGKVAWSLGAASVALLAHNLMSYLHIDWLSVTAAVLLFIGWLAAERLPGRFAPARAGTWTGIAVSSALWLTALSPSGTFDVMGASEFQWQYYAIHFGVYLFALSVVGATSTRWAKIQFGLLANQITHSVALSFIVACVQLGAWAPLRESALWPMTIIAAGIAFAMLQNAVNRGTEQPRGRNAGNWLSVLTTSTLAALSAWPLLIGNLQPGWAITALVIGTIAVSALHQGTIGRRFDVSSALRVATFTAPPVAVLFVTSAIHGQEFAAAATATDLWVVQALFATLAIAGLGAAALGKVPSLGWAIQAARCLGASYALFAFAILPLADFSGSAVEGNLHVLTAGAALAMGTVLTNRIRPGIAWLAASFIGFMASAQALGALSANWLGTDAPETYSISYALAFSACGLLGGNQLSRAKSLLTIDIPLLLASAISLGYAAANDPTEGEQLLRALIALAAISAFAHWRLHTKPALGWLVLAYVAGGSLGLTVGRELVLATGLNHAIELYSLPVVASVLLANRALVRMRSFDSSVVLWGLPLAGLIWPSAFKAAANFATPFAELETEQVVRTLAVLILSATLLIVGVRRGNLGQTGSGLVGLLVISWVRVQSVDDTLRLESNALLLAFTVWLILALIKRFAHTGGNSLLYIGLPLGIAMAPSILTAWQALGNPDLTVVDWWRFGILMAASLALLTVGSLREQAGMFFPGLVGVLTTALPYGFSNIANETWFIWVLLLLIAAILVWLAVRLEQMKKVGKSSTAWLKQLK